MHFAPKELQARELYVQQDDSPLSLSSTWRAVEQMVGGGASAVGVPGGIFVTRQPAQEEPTLLSTQAAIRRLATVRAAAADLGEPLMLVACTHARGAQSLTFDDDRRDWRCLSGQRTQDGSYVYCGGMGAAIDRCLAYAPHADVLCYRAPMFDLTEALRFAHEVSTRFPHKQCAFCLDPRGDESSRSFHDIAALQQKVLRAGFSYFFFYQSGSIVFPAFPVGMQWAVVEDSADPSASEECTPGAWDKPGFDSRRCRKR